MSEDDREADGTETNEDDVADEPRSEAPEPRPKLERRPSAVSRIALAAAAVTALYGTLLALLTGDERGGLVRLVSDAPGNAGPWLLGGYVVALAATVALGLLALARERAVSVALVPAALFLGAGGVLSALAAQAGVAKVHEATQGSRSLVMRAALSHAAFPGVLALTGASMLVGLAALVGLVRLYQIDLPAKRRWGPFVALALTVLLGASLPLSWSSMSLAASASSLVPLAATHYFALAVLAFALPRALRLREAGDDELPALRALVLVAAAAPLATFLSWQASVSAARSAPLPSAGRALADALTLLGPQALGVTVAAAALVVLAAGAGIRRAIRPTLAGGAVLALFGAALATYLWAAITETGLAP